MSEWWQTIERNGWTVRSKRSGLADVRWVLPTVVCVAMMGVLFVLVLGYLNDLAQTEACRSNMKVMGLALSIYAIDYDERLPLLRTANRTSAEHFDWVEKSRNSDLPPDERWLDRVGHCRADRSGGTTLSYALNTRLFPARPAPGVWGGVRLRDVAEPGEVYAILEAHTERGAGNDGLLDPDREWPVARHHRRRDPSTVVGYLDGHFKALPMAQLRGRTAPNGWNPTPAKPEAKP